MCLMCWIFAFCAISRSVGKVDMFNFSAKKGYFFQIKKWLCHYIHLITRLKSKKQPVRIDQSPCRKPLMMSCTSPKQKRGCLKTRWPLFILECEKLFVVTSQDKLTNQYFY